MLKDYTKNGKYTKDLPQSFSARIKKQVRNKKNKNLVSGVIKAVLSEFDPKKDYVTTTRNWRLSRFLSVSKIIKIKLRTCGSICAVVAAVLRKIGLAVKLVDGKLCKDGEWRRHAWLEVKYDKGGQFIPFDPFSPGFHLTKKHRKVATFADWSEMEEVVSKKI